MAVELLKLIDFWPASRSCFSKGGGGSRWTSSIGPGPTSAINMNRIRHVWFGLSLGLLGFILVLSKVQETLGWESYDILAQVKYQDTRTIELKVGQPKEVALLVVFDAGFFSAFKRKPNQKISIEFQILAETPHFSIVQVVNETIWLKNELAQEVNVKLNPVYIGRASIRAKLVTIGNSTEGFSQIDLLDRYRVAIKVTQDEGIYGDIFVVSVSVLIVLSFVSLGAQLDEKSMKEVFTKPMTVLVGTVCSILIMPAASFFIANWLLIDQPLIRYGAFVYACGPAASAATLWSSMFDSDRELAVALQVLSTLGTLVAMPGLLFVLGETIPIEQPQSITMLQTPYTKLIQGSFGIVIALFVGWRFIGRNEQSRKIANSVFRPLTFFVLLYIIVFSSVLYWYLYKMFTWTITLNATLTALSTCLISALLGYLANFSLDQAIVISISSIYKNSGIAFAVLLVALENPDLYVAFVPCLTQVVITSLALYMIYALFKLVNKLRRRNQPDPIQASQPIDDNHSVVEEKHTKRANRSGSSSDKSVNNDEFIVMNVNDYVEPPDSPSLNREEVNNDQANGETSQPGTSNTSQP